MKKKKEGIKLPELPTIGEIKLPALPTTPGKLADKKKGHLDSEKLFKLAEEMGLGDKATEVLKEKGEEANVFMSGGPVSDIFDGLNMLQYGMVGLAKGKSFAEGIRTRASFSDKDSFGAMGKWQGMVFGTIADIAFDPLTYTPAVLKHLGIAGKLSKMGIGTKTMEIMTKTKAGRFFNNKFVGWFSNSDQFWDDYARNMHAVGEGWEKAVDLTKPLFGFEDSVRRSIVTARKAGKMSKLNPEVLAKAKPAYDSIDDMMYELHKLGKVTKEDMAEYTDKYLVRAYKMFDDPSWSAKRGMTVGEARTYYKPNPKVGFGDELDRLLRKKDKFGVTFKNKNGVKITKKFEKYQDRNTYVNKLVNAGRADDIIDSFNPLPLEVRQALGEIVHSGYPEAKSIFDMSKLIANTKLLNSTASTFAQDAASTGFRQLPFAEKWGALSGKWVPEPLEEILQETFRKRTTSEKAWKKLVGGFKYNKIILSPGAHMRNMASNPILNWWKNGMNPLDPRTMSSYKQGAAELFAKKGGQYIDEIRPFLGKGTHAAQEIMSLLGSPESSKAFTAKRNVIMKVADKLSGAYQKSEEFAKLSAYIFNRKFKKMDITSAWRKAESATFNYARVTPFIRKVREAVWGYPFITFTAKATPLVIETAIKNPARISAFGKIKTSIENQSGISKTRRERASEPGWIRDGFFIKLPMKDKHGRSAYFDLTYIIPFGDLIAGQLTSREVDSDTGLKEGQAVAMLKNSPVLNLIGEMSKNQDFYGKKIWKDSDSNESQLGDLFIHMFKAYMPPLFGDAMPGGYNMEGPEKGKRRPGMISRLDKAGKGNQYRTGTEEVLRNAGMKVQPVSVEIQEQYHEWEKKKALTTLLKEADILRDFKRLYVPKQK